MNTWTRRNRRVTLRWTFSCLLMASAMVFAATPARANPSEYEALVDPDDNLAIMQEVADALLLVENTFGVGPLTARTGWMPAEYYAAARGTSIVINKVWSTGSYDTFAAVVNADIADGYHNGGCSPIRTVALHEAAHVIENVRGGVPGHQVLAAVGSGPRPDLRGALSGYSFDSSGAVDPSEALAEAFQAVMCGTAGPAEQELYEILVG